MPQRLSLLCRRMVDKVQEKGQQTGHYLLQKVKRTLGTPRKGTNETEFDDPSTLSLLAAGTKATPENENYKFTDITKSRIAMSTMVLRFTLHNSFGLSFALVEWLPEIPKHVAEKKIQPSDPDVYLQPRRRSDTYNLAFDPRVVKSLSSWEFGFPDIVSDRLEEEIDPLSKDIVSTDLVEDFCHDSSRASIVDSKWDQSQDQISMVNTSQRDESDNLYYRNIPRIHTGKIYKPASFMLKFSNLKDKLTKLKAVKSPDRVTVVKFHTPGFALYRLTVSELIGRVRWGVGFVIKSDSPCHHHSVRDAYYVMWDDECAIDECIRRFNGMFLGGCIGGSVTDYEKGSG